MKLSNYDLMNAVYRLPKALRSMMKERPELLIAGGYLRSVVTGEPVQDIDVFAPSADVARACASALSEWGKHRVIETANAITVCLKPWPVQFIHRWVFPTPQSAIESFDFTIARAAFWHGPFETGTICGNEWQSVCDDNYYQDLAAKRLVYCAPVRIEEVGGSMLRVLKFYQRGYRIPLDSLASVIARLNSGIHNIGHLAEFEQHKVISGLLREVDPLIDPDHISHLPEPPQEQ